MLKLTWSIMYSENSVTIFFNHIHNCIHEVLFLSPDSIRVITDISTVQAVILSSQLKEMLMNVSSQDTFQGMYKAIKLVYHPREPFFIVRQVNFVPKGRTYDYI